MTMYLTIILIAVIFISSFNILCNSMTLGYSPFWTICVVVLGVIIEIAIDGVFAFIVHSLPNKLFTKDRKIFEVSRKERKFYEKLNIKNWKDKVAELGALGGFSKSKVQNPNEPKYLEQFIIENNKGIAVHISGIIFGFLILLFPMPKYCLYIGLPIALVNVYLNTLSTMVLRYNIPKLKVALQRAEKQVKLKQEDLLKIEKESEVLKENNKSFKTEEKSIKETNKTIENLKDKK